MERPSSDAQAPAEWREDIDALQFRVDNHDGVCIVHRLAFRSLLGFTPGRQDCLAHYAAHAGLFAAAARAKIGRGHVARGRNFHLTSRDIGGRQSSPD